MDALDVARICARRWYVFLTVVALAAYAGFGLLPEAAPVYQATGNFAVVYRLSGPPTPGVDPRAANPLAAGNGALMRQSVVNDLNSAASQRQLGNPSQQGTAPGQTPDGSLYVVANARGSDTVTVQTWGPSRAAALATVGKVLAAAQGRATTLQQRAGAPAKSRYTTFVTLAPQSVMLPPASRVKVIVSISAVGLLVGAALSLLLDRALTRRRRRKLERAATGRHARPAGDEDATAAPSSEPATAASSTASSTAPATAGDEDHEGAGPATVREPVGSGPANRSSRSWREES